MADEILRVDKPQTTDRTGKAVWVQRGGAGTSSTYDDEWILPDDFLAPEQTRLGVNELAIADHETRITTLENGLTKTLNKNHNSSFTITQNADSRIINFGFRFISSIPTVKVGTAAGLADIVDEQLVTSEYSYDVSEYTLLSRTLYITISGGFVDVVRLSRENLYEV